MMGQRSIEITISGVKRVLFIFDNLVERLVNALPPTVLDVGMAILRNLQGRAATFAITGTLMESMTLIQEDPFTVVVGPTAPYANFVSFGTRAHFIGSRIEILPGVWRFIGMHPGSAPNPYMQDAVSEEFRNLQTFLKEHVDEEVDQLGVESEAYEDVEEEMP